MGFFSFGDLAVSYGNVANNTRIKAELHRLANELSTGVTSDVSAKTGGDLGAISDIETSLRRRDAYGVVINEAALFAQSLQQTLGSIQEITSTLGPALLLAANTNEATLIQTSANDAKEHFAGVVSALNTKVANRALLAGNNTDTTPLLGADGILAQLRLEVAAETTAAGVEARVVAWFDDAGGGFETLAYQGSLTDLEPFRLGDDDKTSISLRADDQAVRDLLKGYALAALVAEDALAGDIAERAALIQSAGTRLVGADHGLSELRAGIGTAEERIEIASTRNAAEHSALEIARTEILQIDPYKTATDLQHAETQLQTLYAITARLSRLNLSEFLR